MKIKKILISQPEPADIQKSPYFNIIDKYNISVDFKKFITVEGISAIEFRRNKIYPQEYSAVIMTSRNAIDHFFRIAKELRYDIPDSLKYFCNSESTAFYLQKYIQYRKRKVFHGKQSPEEMMVHILKNKNEKFLLPCSEVHGNEVTQLLDNANINYQEAILYRTVSSDIKELNITDYDMIVLFTPSGVKSLFDNFPKYKQEETIFCGFGESTHKAIKKAGLRLDIATPTPESPSMSMAIENYLKNNK